MFSCSDWDVEGDDVKWSFRYKRAGYKNTILVVCSIDVSTGRMLISAMEDGKQTCHTMGLVVDNYVKTQNTSDWEECFPNEERFLDYVHKYIILPLHNGADKFQSNEAFLLKTSQFSSTSRGKSFAYAQRAPSSEPVLLYALAAMAAAGAAFHMYKKWSITGM